ncbi:ATP-binding protein [Alteromonas lipolytica]|uniref:histidine kinase n=1 Tax=Alteromonas lipolytica TaxID=1856405 RepID=A0A1E8F8R8_9ALTE|nr:ATP-binding protein [Alteromonas lipolytica]OFI32305.1 hypothetical protein BFC17_07590 [Alteromonas lipolytica]GGF85623.1 hypothetical protein GCM10011338_42440 [Alteromonas lipolytica]
MGYTKLSRVMYLVVIIVVIAIGIITDSQLKKSLDKVVAEDANNNLREIDGMITHEYESFLDEIAFLYTTPPISGLTRAAQHNGIDPRDGTTTALWKDRLTQIFKGFMENHREYFQLRVIDATGQEFIRVDRAHGRISAVDSNDLQNKSDRYYFQDTMALSEGDIFTSVIDLNKEFGKLSIPYRPTVRFARPIFDDDNQPFGMIIANIDVKGLLDSLNRLVGDYMQIIIADGDGYFVKHPIDALQYSRNLSPNSKFSTTYAPVTTLPLNRYGQYKVIPNNALLWGMGQEIVASSDPSGGALSSYVFVTDDYYQQALMTKRFETFTGLAVLLCLALFALYRQNRHSHQLTASLAISDEAKAAVDVAKDSIVTVNKHWQINTVNRAFERTFHVTSDEMVGVTLPAFIKQLSGTDLSEKIDSMTNASRQFECTWARDIDTPDEKWFSCMVNPILSPHTNARYAVVIRDITAERLAMTTVEQANKKLEEQVASRTKELETARDKALEVSTLKTNFISTISHEMRTPLNGIVGATGLLKAEPLNTRQHKFVQMAENSVDTLKRLINDVLDLSKIEAGKLELSFKFFNPEALFESITSTMSVVAYEKDLGFYIDTTDIHFSSIYSDPYRLTQVINNLLSNAIKFSAEGHISVKAWSTQKEDKGWLCFEVSDTGTGISKSNQQKLFAAFTQADETIAASFGGSGLGLSICREILTLLGGTISLQSEEGVGTQFLVELPVDEWKDKPSESFERLSGKEIGMAIDALPLSMTISNLIEHTGGKVVRLSQPFTAVTLDKLDFVFVNTNHSFYQAVIDEWMKICEHTKARLVIIANPAHPCKQPPPNGKTLVEPVYRSMFLSVVTNERIENETFTQITDERRRSAHEHSLSNEQIEPLGLNVLVVDDNEINRQVASYIMEPLDITTTIAENGLEAIDVLRDASPAIDVILMDCNMPVLNGYESTRAIRAGDAGEQYQSVPIIAMTANAMKGESDKCYQAGMNDYITKPVDPAVLFSKLNNIKQTKASVLAPEAENKAPVDPSLWDKEGVIARLSGNEDLLEKLMHLFLRDYQSKLMALENAVKSDDRDALKFSAHAYKGNAADIGAIKLSELLEVLDDNASQLTIEEIQSIFTEVKMVSKLTAQVFEIYLNQGH